MTEQLTFWGFPALRLLSSMICELDVLSNHLGWYNYGVKSQEMGASEWELYAATCRKWRFQ